MLSCLSSTNSISTKSHLHASLLSSLGSSSSSEDGSSSPELSQQQQEDLVGAAESPNRYAPNESFVTSSDDCETSVKVDSSIVELNGTLDGQEASTGDRHNCKGTEREDFLTDISVSTGADCQVVVISHDTLKMILADASSGEKKLKLIDAIIEQLCSLKSKLFEAYGGHKVASENQREIDRGMKRERENKCDGQASTSPISAGSVDTKGAAAGILQDAQTGHNDFTIRSRSPKTEEIGQSPLPLSGANAPIPSRLHQSTNLTLSPHSNSPFTSFTSFSDGNIGFTKAQVRFKLNKIIIFTVIIPCLTYPVEWVTENEQSDDHL